MNPANLHGTTVLGLFHKGTAVMAGDGQVTYGDIVLKAGARKVRKIFNDSVLAGFAGTLADAVTLFERFENRLGDAGGHLGRAAVELAKEWRTDRYLRRLDADLAVMDKKTLLIVSGNGDVVEPDDQIVTIGSGGSFARIAAKALMTHSSLNAEQIAKEAMKLTAEMCIYTNDRIHLETL
ncbi:MAG: ATP-dependent protease subunit HslV [candidate division KSB1 bacterium]|nr:ATP-dependent protease subunit HslV [candidate division KSB1 bacterium]